jgi:endonuclease-3 related protein
MPNRIRKPAPRAARPEAADEAATATLRAMYAQLLASYGPRNWWPAESPFEVVLGAYLTQATAWTSVERSIANLRSAGVLSVAGIRATAEERLRELIRPSGFVQRKAASIRAFVGLLDARYGGALERMAAEPTEMLRRELLALPGTGPERRVATRHALVRENARYAELQQLGDAAVASTTSEETARHANELHALIVEVGKRHCGSSPRCEGCPLAPFLPGRA